MVGPYPVHAIKADVGLGKSTVTRRWSAIRLRELRAAGDKRTIVFAVPTAKLGREQVEKFQALPEAHGLVARVRLGRERPDPEHPDFTNSAIPDNAKTRMCRDLDAVADAQEAMLDVQTAVCIKRNADGATNAQCPHFGVCGYQRQRRQRGDLWFMAHEHLFLTKPAEIGDPAVIIIDEAPWDAGLIGHEGRHISLPVDTVRHGDTTIPNASLTTARLGFLRTRLADVLDTHPNGPLARGALLAADFSVANCTEARALEWQRKIDVKMWPGMPKKDRKEAAKAAKANKTIWRLSLMWRAVASLVAPDGPVASGWARLALADPEEGTVRVLRLKGRREVAKGWRKPTLLIDATLQPDLIRPFWPTLEVTAEISVGMPHQHVTQVGDLTYSKRQLDREGNMAGVRAIVCREARMKNGQVLVVAQMNAEESLRTCGLLPNNVVTAHHNAIAGRDEWREVVKLIVIGRTAPPPAAVERQAEAMTGDAIESLVGWYATVAVAREMTNGTWCAAEADRHPHPIADAMRWHATEGELIQILGRARGADRTTANPVDILMMVNTMIPIPIERVIAAESLSPSVVDRMLAAGGVALTNPADAADCYPGLWGTGEGARTAWKRGTLVHSLIDKYLSGSEPKIAALTLATYQRVGRGQRPTQALFDTYLVPDPLSWLEVRFGPLATFRFSDPPELAAMRAMTTIGDAEKLARRTTLRPSPPAYQEGCVPLVPDGCGVPLGSLHGMESISGGNITDIVTITSSTRTLLIMTSGLVIVMTEHRTPRFDW